MRIMDCSSDVCSSDLRFRALPTHNVDTPARLTVITGQQHIRCHWPTQSSARRITMFNFSKVSSLAIALTLVGGLGLSNVASATAISAAANGQSAQLEIGRAHV